MSDKLCREHGLSVVVPGKDSKRKGYAEYQAEKTGTSWKGKLKIAVDALIPQVADFNELVRGLKAAGISDKLPNIAALQADYAKFQEQREALYADYGKLKKQVGEYDVIKR